MSGLQANECEETGEARPIPVRYWWLKRIGLACGVLVVLLGGLRSWWGCYADRQLQARIDYYHGLGQPVLREDFIPQPLADEQNAAHFLSKAFAAIVQPDGVTLTVDDIRSNPELVAQYPGKARALIEANRPAVLLARKARTRFRANWNLQFATPFSETLLPHISEQKTLARHLGAAAIHNNVCGNDGEAIEAIRDMLVVSDRVNDCPLGFITYFSSLAISRMAVGTVEVISPSLEIGDFAGDVPHGAPAPREQVRALVDALLDDAELRESWREAVHLNRLTQLESLDLVSPNGEVLRFTVGPAWRIDVARMLDTITQIGEAGLARDFSAARARLPVEPDWWPGNDGVFAVVRLLSSIQWPWFDRALELRFRAIAIRRMAATALAIRLYEIDHGRRPISLTELVPVYLEAVPLDPFAGDGRVLGYLRDAKSPRLYSVGPDGKDDGGSFAVSKYGNVHRDSADIPFFLNGDRPRSPPEYPRADDSTGEAVDDGEDEDDDQGDSEEDETSGEQP